MKKLIDCCRDVRGQAVTNCVITQMTVDRHQKQLQQQPT